MFKKIILILLISNCSLIYGQYEWTSGVIILKNGETKEGLIQIPMTVASLISFGKSRVEFKKDEDHKIQLFDKSQVDKIYFDAYDANHGHYEYVPIKKNKFRLFKLIVNGKAKLYTRTIVVATDITNHSGFVIRTEYEEEKEYYILRDGESSLTPLISHYSFLEFKEKTIKYFSDCKDIVEYLRNDMYEEKDVFELVNDYNLICE
ncbi:hypothetical protein FG167_14265 [Lacinutrix sp. WUR7]|uniref:hypothetical protein n=1 Tax=Lacinutrix sp. WUR7 TaxID=2653681 RepID=UPI00193CEBFC|nr:hypothetical protein [Lacinutrix sp. WUR7]QRM90351.1 hypothetical protein FG167_14265 [Lacinutrix sp. WUR7]